MKDYSTFTEQQLAERENSLVAELGRLEFYEITGQISRPVYRMRKTDMVMDVLTLQREMKRRAK